MLHNKVDLIASIFDSAIEVQKELNVDDQRTRRSKSDEQKVDLLKGKLTDEVNKEIEESVFLSLVNADEEELNITKDFTITAVNTVMSSRILASNVENAKKKLKRNFVIQVLIMI